MFPLQAVLRRLSPNPFQKLVAPSRRANWRTPSKNRVLEDFYGRTLPLELKHASRLSSDPTLRLVASLGPQSSLGHIRRAFRLVLEASERSSRCFWGLECAPGHGPSKSHRTPRWVSCQ